MGQTKPFLNQILWSTGETESLRSILCYICLAQYCPSCCLDSRAVGRIQSALPLSLPVCAHTKTSEVTKKQGAPVTLPHLSSMNATAATHCEYTKTHLDVAVAFGIVDVAELSGALAVLHVRLEDATRTLTLTTDDAPHGDCKALQKKNDRLIIASVQWPGLLPRARQSSIWHRI